MADPNITPNSCFGSYSYRFLAEDLGHPSLRVKKIKGTDRIWEARVSRSIRLTFEMSGELVILRNTVHHAEALGKP